MKNERLNKEKVEQIITNVLAKYDDKDDVDSFIPEIATEIMERVSDFNTIQNREIVASKGKINIGTIPTEYFNIFMEALDKAIENWGLSDEQKDNIADAIAQRILVEILPEKHNEETKEIKENTEPQKVKKIKFNNNPKQETGLIYSIDELLNTDIL